jgi:Fe-S oxidoreductase
VGLKLFIPCFIDQGAPQIGAATVELLHRLRVPWEYPEDQTCYGFGGTFKVQHADLAREMGETYLEAVRATGADGVVSLDYSCLMHLRGVAASRAWNLQFFHLAEILVNDGIK